MSRADIYVQDEVQVSLYPTLARPWSWKGHQGRRLVGALGNNQRCSGFGAVDWRGRLSFGFRSCWDADIFHSAERGRITIVLADNAGNHTPRGSRLPRHGLAMTGEAQHLVCTAAYDPESHQLEWLWRIFRCRVTHDHQRDDFLALDADAEAEIARPQADRASLLQHTGGPSQRPDTALSSTA